MFNVSPLREAGGWYPGTLLTTFTTCESKIISKLKGFNKLQQQEENKKNPFNSNQWLQNITESKFLISLVDLTTGSDEVEPQ